MYVKYVFVQAILETYMFPHTSYGNKHFFQLSLLFPDINGKTDVSKIAMGMFKLTQHMS